MVRLAASRAPAKAGNKIETSKAMMATTISTSINVNARVTGFNEHMCMALPQRWACLSATVKKTARGQVDSKFN
jgi:hypothetical protein